MVAAAHRLRRFDWTMYLATFMVEEAKHAEFFMLWHHRVAGMLEPDELARHFLARSKTVDPTGRFEIRDIMHTGLPDYGDALAAACAGGSEEDVERAFVRFSTAYNALAEGVLTMPSYEIVIDTCDQWGAFPALKQGFRRILADEGRHITFGTAACRLLIDKDPSYEEAVHEVFDEYRGNVVGLVEYQKAVPGLDVQKYQQMKVRHYRSRCREMGVDAGRDDDRADPRPQHRLRRRRRGRLMLRWVCLDAGCDTEITAPDEDALLERAHAHIAEAHSSFELEDVILAAVERVPDPPSA